MLLLFTCSGFAQIKISGTVTGQNPGAVEIFNITNDKHYFSDATGNFSFEVSETKAYQLTFYKSGYALEEVSVVAPVENLSVVLTKINSLSEVVVRNQNEKLFALRRLKDVEETAIYAGKKTEVIRVENLTANKATNNARQVFAQVVGLTINESSDGGLQLSIGGRGLNPNRTSNFNTRQNGYDISADVLGYPESYYATPTEALSEIQVIRGAASLQYGTQFGGLINFKLKNPSPKPIEFTTRNTVGSFGLFTNFTSIGGTVGKFSYYSYYNYKQGDGFRPNGNFESQNYFANLNYQFNAKTSLHFDYTYFDYLAQQSGGLTDAMFYDNPKQSNRTRNWFDVNWNLFALRLKHQFNENALFSLQLFGLDASRKTVGFRPNRVSSDDVVQSERDLILGEFQNWGAEARYLQHYNLLGNKSTFLIGAKYYRSHNSGIQGPGSSQSDADFNLATSEFPNFQNQSNYLFPNENIAVFGENIFKITERFSVTPGFRYEKIRTQAAGSFRKINLDLAGNVIFDTTEYENNIKDRDFVLFGVGLSYKPKNRVEFYGNVSQNYRSVTFNDIRTAIPNQEIDPNITDEKGYTSDVGIRGQIANTLTFDASAYGLYYNDKIGDRQNVGSNGAPGRIRANIGTALTYGFETLFDWSLGNTFFKSAENFKWNLFVNSAITNSEYLKSNAANIKGNKVEFVPLFNVKGGTGIGFGNFLASVQLMYLSEQFTDADNSTVDKDDNTTGIFGAIPSYYVADFSASYKWRQWKLETGITNFTNNSYFTRRATGYPGPGIIPSDARSFYTTLEFTF